MRELKVSRHLQVGVLSVCSLAMAIQLGCGKSLTQDPLADKSEDIRNGQPPGQKPTPGPTPEDTQMLQIDSKDFYTFREGRDGDAQITGRVLGQIDGEEAVLGRHFVFRIENLQDFKGATFDGRTGVFKWRPSTDLVDKDFSKSITMNVTMETTRGKMRIRSKAINVFVVRDDSDPEIVYVEDLSMTYTREGTMRDFQVTVKDPDAEDTAAGRPKLLVTNAQSGTNASGLVSVLRGPVRDSSRRDHWNFTMRFDASLDELTTSESNVAFGLIAVTRYGRNSAPRAVDVKVRTQVGEPTLSWSEKSWDVIEFKTGQENLMSFTVFDPKNEGEVSASFNRCEIGAVCECKTSSNRSYVLCQIRWKIDPKARTGDFTFSGSAMTKSPNWSDPSVSRSFSRVIRVQPGPPAPTPVPMPTPTICPTPTPGTSPTPRRPRELSEEKAGFFSLARFGQHGGER